MPSPSNKIYEFKSADFWEFDLEGRERLSNRGFIREVVDETDVRNLVSVIFQIISLSATNRECVGDIAAISQLSLIFSLIIQQPKGAFSVIISNDLLSVFLSSFIFSYFSTKRIVEYFRMQCSWMLLFGTHYFVYCLSSKQQVHNAEAIGTSSLPVFNHLSIVRERFAQAKLFSESQCNDYP